jgi:hypothetical protein
MNRLARVRRDRYLSIAALLLGLFTAVGIMSCIVTGGFGTTEKMWAYCNEYYPGNYPKVIFGRLVCIDPRANR